MQAEVKIAKNNQVTAAALALLMMLAGLLFLATITFMPQKQSQDLAVFFPPSLTLTDIAARIAPLSVDMVRAGFLDTIVILRPQNSFQISELQAAGAWLVLDAYASGGCSFFRKKPAPLGCVTT